MRQTTRGTLKMCFAICAAMMLRLSPSVTATKPSASSTPARRKTSASVPLPTTWLPLKSLVSTPRDAARENWLGSLSMITTSWPALSMSAASCEPTRPQPTMRGFKALDYREAPARPRHGQAPPHLLLGFGRLRFPFTFMGVMALGIRVWVLIYLAGHRWLDPAAQAIAGTTVVISWGFGLYVLLRRVRRGPQL